MVVLSFIFCGFGGSGTMSFIIKILDSMEVNLVIKSVVLLSTLVFVFITASWLGSAVAAKLHYDAIVEQAADEDKNKDSADNV